MRASLLIAETIADLTVERALGQDLS
jgi:hypothetical protein